MGYYFSIIFNLVSNLCNFIAKMKIRPAPSLFLHYTQCQGCQSHTKFYHLLKNYKWLCKWKMCEFLQVLFIKNSYFTFFYYMLHCFLSNCMSNGKRLVFEHHDLFLVGGPACMMPFSSFCPFCYTTPFPPPCTINHIFQLISCQNNILIW